MPPVGVEELRIFYEDSESLETRQIVFPWAKVLGGNIYLAEKRGEEIIVRQENGFFLNPSNNGMKIVGINYIIRGSLD